MRLECNKNSEYMLARAARGILFVSIGMLSSPIALSEPARVSLVSTLDTCLSRLADESNHGQQVRFIELDKRCPMVRSRLVEHPLSDMLLEPLPKVTNTHELRQLRSLAKSFESESALSDIGPDPTRITDAIALTMLDDDQPPAEETLWDKIKKWLDRKVEASEDTDPQWLKDLVKNLSIPDLASKIILYGTAAVASLMLLVIVYRELRAAGLLAKRRRATPVPLDVTIDNRNFTPENPKIDESDVAQRLANLLRVAIATQIRNGNLPADYSRTNRQFATLLKARNDQLANVFLDLIDLAERVVYGGQSATDDQAQSLTHRAHATGLAEPQA